MDGMSYQPALPGFRAPPLAPPILTDRVIMRLAILQLKEAAARCRSMEVAALATALEAATDGYTDEAREALAGAELMRGVEA
jgi:hypothetical protein